MNQQFSGNLYPNPPELYQTGTNMNERALNNSHQVNQLKGMSTFLQKESQISNAIINKQQSNSKKNNLNQENENKKVSNQKLGNEIIKEMNKSKESESAITGAGETKTIKNDEINKDINEIPKKDKAQKENEENQQDKIQDVIQNNEENQKKEKKEKKQKSNENNNFDQLEDIGEASDLKSEQTQNEKKDKEQEKRADKIQEQIQEQKQDQEIIDDHPLKQQKDSNLSQDQQNKIADKQKEKRNKLEPSGQPQKVLEKTTDEELLDQEKEQILNNIEKELKHIQWEHYDNVDYYDILQTTNMQNDKLAQAIDNISSLFPEQTSNPTRNIFEKQQKIKQKINQDQSLAGDDSYLDNLIQSIKIK